MDILGIHIGFTKKTTYELEIIAQAKDLVSSFLKPHANESSSIPPVSKSILDVLNGGKKNG